MDDLFQVFKFAQVDTVEATLSSSAFASAVGTRSMEGSKQAKKLFRNSELRAVTRLFVPGFSYGNVDVFGLVPQ